MQKEYFLSQPHQPFFVLAFVNAITTMLMFMLHFKGILSLHIDAGEFHAYGLIFMLFTPAFIAFLFTTFPRFCATDVIEKPVYMSVLMLFVLGSVLFEVGVFVAPLMYKIGMVVLFLGNVLAFRVLYNIYKASQMPDKHDPFWILAGLGFGVLSHLLFLVDAFTPAHLHLLIFEIAIYLYLFIVAFSVAQRMVPFFSHCMVEKDEGLLRLLTLLLVARVVVAIALPHYTFVIDFFVAYLVAKELYRWKLPFPNPNPILWILHLSLFWIPVAFVLGGLSHLISLLTGADFLYLDFHALILGFVFTILLGFGTRVTLGHSGNQMMADTWIRNLFYGIQVVVILRLATSFVAGFGWNFMVLFDISATAWLLLFIAWATRFFAVLIKGKKL